MTAPEQMRAEEPTREQIDEWLTEHCARGLPYVEATDLPTALHGLAYTLRQIESTNSYRPHIGQCIPAQSALRWSLDYIARNEMNTRPAPAELVEALRSEIINTPETADFMAGVPIEAAHQRERWGADHDAGKQPLDWFWLIGYLAQKAATSAMAGDVEKAKHHTISTAAALANWHAALTGADTRMRPGIEPPTALRNAGAAS